MAAIDQLKRLAPSLVASFRRRWHQSLGFRLRIWAAGALVIVGVASLSIKAAIFLGAVAVALSLGYGHAVIWMSRVTVRLIRRLARR